LDFPIEDRGEIELKGMDKKKTYLIDPQARPAADIGASAADSGGTRALYACKPSTMTWRSNSGIEEAIVVASAAQNFNAMSLFLNILYPSIF
jgi:hypothetical protein